MTNDLSVGEVAEKHMAGMVSFKLSIHNATKDGDFDYTTVKDWAKPPPKRPDEVC